jgi:hypothetical protein
LRNVGVAQMVNLVVTSQIYNANLTGCVMEQGSTYVPNQVAPF